MLGCTEVGESHLQGCGRVSLSIWVGAKCMREARRDGDDTSGVLQTMDSRVVPGYVLCSGAPFVSFSIKIGLMEWRYAR